MPSVASSVHVIIVSSMGLDIYFQDSSPHMKYIQRNNVWGRQIDWERQRKGEGERERMKDRETSRMFVYFKLV